MHTTVKSFNVCYYESESNICSIISAVNTLHIWWNLDVTFTTKVKLAALSPAALTIACEVRQKNFELSRGDKETIFSLQWTGKQYQNSWKPFSTKNITLKCKTHLQNKKTTS